MTSNLQKISFTLWSDCFIDLVDWYRTFFISFNNNTKIEVLIAIKLSNDWNQKNNIASIFLSKDSRRKKMNRKWMPLRQA